MSSRLTRVSAGTALAVALTLGCGMPALADTTIPEPAAPDTTSTVDAPNDAQPLNAEDPGDGGTDPGDGGTDPGDGGTDPGDGGTDPGDGGTDPGDGGVDPGTDPGEGSAPQPKPQPGANAGTGSQSSSKPTNYRTTRTSHAQLAETGADPQSVLRGSLIATALGLAGASALLFSRSGVQLRRRAKNEA